MKKLLLIFALVAVYGISVSNVSAKVAFTENSEITVLTETADTDGITIEDDKKDKKKAAEATPACGSEKVTTAGAATVEEPSAGCSEAQKKSCATAGKSCCGEEKEEKK